MSQQLYATIKWGRVLDLSFDAPSAALHPLSGPFEVPANLLGQVAIGWSYDGETFTPPHVHAPSTADLVQYAKAYRRRMEQSGVVVNGIPIATDDRSKTMILGARIAAMANPNWTTVWVATDGNSYLITAAQMIAISDAVQAQINRAFTVYSEAVAGISTEPATITTTGQINALFLSSH